MAAFLEIAASAVSQSGQPQRALIDVAILNPLVLSEQGSCTAQVIVEGDSVQVFSLNGEEWKLHASARLGEISRPHESDLSLGHGEGGEAIEPETFYGRLREHNVDFGPSFRVVKSLHAGAGQAVGRVHLGDREMRNASRYQMHPALLDGCFQTALAAAPHAFAGTYLPFGVDRFEMFGPVGSEVWARARITSGPANDDTITANIDVVDAKGILLARVEGLHFRRRRSANPAWRKIYEVQWRKSELAPHRATGSGHWLIVADDPMAGTKLADCMRERGCQVAVSG